MSPSNKPHSFQLHYIPYFFKNPDRHFLGFSQGCQTDDRRWYETHQDLQRLLINWRSIRIFIKKNCHLSFHALPLYLRERRNRYGERQTCAGFALLTIPDDHTEKSRFIKKVNRCVIQALFALPRRKELESDVLLIARLNRDRINPGVPTLEELCTDIASLYFSETQIKHLPILLQKTIIYLQKKKEQYHI